MAKGNKRKTWTKEEYRSLKKMMDEGVSLKAAMKRLGRNDKSVDQKARRLGGGTLNGLLYRKTHKNLPGYLAIAFLSGVVVTLGVCAYVIGRI